MDSLDISKLRPDTAQVWAALKDEPLLKGFALIGGTALTMHIGHRVSEDLDFAYVESSRHLPKAQIRGLKRSLANRGVTLAENQSALDVEEFLNSGLDLNDYQQNFIANGSVKVSLVCFDPPMDKLLRGTASDPLRVATKDELFQTKAFVCADRSRQRDWLDLYTLLNFHGYTMRDVYDVFQQVNSLAKFNIAQSRLRSCSVEASDPGYETLLPDPPSIDDMRAYFAQELDALEIALARERLHGVNRL